MFTSLPLQAFLAVLVAVQPSGLAQRVGGCSGVKWEAHRPDG